MKAIAASAPAARVDASSVLRSLLSDLGASAGALAALAAAFNARVTERPLSPSLERGVGAVLGALGVQELVDQLPLAELRSLLAELRVFADSHRRLEGSVPPEPGWSPQSAELIRAAGDASAALPRLIARAVAPGLSELARRLDAPGARFLDVGAGAATLSIGMARAWPRLSVVGIEPWGPALELARENVRAAGLDARVALRAEAGEPLADEASYDLAWIPSLFIGEAALPAVIERVRRALRSGAWLILPVLRADPSSLPGGVVRLRAALWGGSAPTLPDAASWLASAGFVDLQSFSSSATSATGLLAARKATAREA